MKATKPGRANSRTWTYQVGHRPLTVTAYERADRNGVVAVRYYVPTRHDYAKRSTGLTVRTPDGKLDPVRVLQVQSLVAEQYKQLTAGTTPQSPTGTGPVTLAAGFVQALAVGTGMYATDTSTRREMVQLASDVQDILGRNRTFESIRPTDAATVWRKIATDSKNGRKRTINNGWTTREIAYGGPRMAERATDLLFRAARWHYDTGRIAAPPQAPRNWQVKLREEWADITGTVPVPANPRHDWCEVKKMHAARARADPRAVLLFALAFEARMGQAVRCFRSALDITPGVGACGLGTFEVAGRHKKRGVFIDLGELQRAALDEALTFGYLSTLETEFQAGRIRDYALFPAGRLKKGVAQLKRGVKALTDDGLAGIFRKWEEVAGVSHEPGRGWYGLRRIGADRTADETSDARVLNFIRGHRNSSTREGYQNDRDLNVRKSAAAVREAKRRMLSEPDSEPGQ